MTNRLDYIILCSLQPSRPQFIAYHNAPAAAKAHAEAGYQIFHNVGNAKSSVISSVSVAVNIALNAVFIFGLLGFPQMGIAGAALATVSARAMEVLWCVLETAKKDSIKLRFGNLRRDDKSLCRDFWKSNIHFRYSLAWPLKSVAIRINGLRANKRQKTVPGFLEIYVPCPWE